MNIKKIFSVILLLSLSVSLSACLKINTGAKNNKQVVADSGFFVSGDKGEKWIQQTAMLSTDGVKRSFSTESLASMAVDPGDQKTIYYGTVAQGLLMTTDRGQSWSLVKSLGGGTISAIALDPTDKCIVYVARANSLMKTDDCARTWKTVFTDTEKNILVTSVDVDHFNANNVYLTLSRGDLIKSSNKGTSWQTIHRFGARVNKFVIDPSDSRRMYADVAKIGISRSDDSGVKWESIKDLFKEYKMNGVVVDIELLKEVPNLILLATEKGILKSDDRGKTWKQLSLIPPANDASIVSLAVNPKNTNEIYYITDTTFYKSVDAGVNWTTKPLPTTSRGKMILLDNSAPEFLYLGVTKK